MPRLSTGMHGAYALRRDAQEEKNHEYVQKCNEGGGIFASRKLLAALAVLTVAFVVFAAVPAVATDSDADTTESIDIVAAGYISDADTAKAVLKSLRVGESDTSVSFNTISTSIMFVVYKTTVNSMNVTKDVYKGETKIGTESATSLSAGLHSFYFYVGEAGDGIVNGDGAIVGDAFDESATYKIVLSKTAETSTTNDGSASAVGDNISFKGKDSIVGKSIQLQSDLEISKNISIKANELDLNGCGVTVKNGATLTLEAASFTTEFLKNKNTSKASPVSAEGQGSAVVVTNKALAATDDNKGRSLVMSNGGSYGGIAFAAKSGASMAFYSQDSKVSTLQTGSGNTTIAIDGEESKLIYNAGSAQNVGVILTGKASASISTLAGTSFAGYFSLNGSTLSADRVNAYSISLVGSTMTVKDLAFYPGSGTNGYTAVDALKDLTTGSATVDANSRLKATGTIFSNGFYTGANFTMTAIAFNGLGFVEGDLAFINDMVTSNAKRTNLAGFTLKSITYTGTASYTTEKTVDGKTVVVTSTAAFKNAKMSSNGMTIKAGSIDLAGEMEQAAEDGKSSLTVTGEIKVTDDVTIPEGFTLVVEGTITADNGKKITNNGTIETAAGADITGVDIVNEGEGAVVSTQDESDMRDASLSGQVSGATFEADQKVTIDKDTEILKGELVIKGLLVVNEGVTLTIDAGAKLIVKNNANVRILGDLRIISSDISTVDDGMLIVEFGTVEIMGNLDVDGIVEIAQGSLVIDAGASAEVADIKTEKGTGKVVVSSDASLTVTGAVSKDSSFEVAGILVIESSVVSGSFGVLLDQGTLDIVKVILGETVTKGETTTSHTCNDASIAVTDKGVEVYDKTKKMDLPNGAPAKGNEFVISENIASKYADGVTSYDVDYGYGVAISGITVASTMKETKIVYDGVNTGSANKSTKIAGTSMKYATSSSSPYIGKYEHAYTMTVSGSISASAEIVFDGLQNRPTVDYNTTTANGSSTSTNNPLASFALTGNVAAVIADALVLPTDTVMSVSAGNAVIGSTTPVSVGSAVIDGAVALAAKVQSTDELRAGAVLTVGPSTASNDSKASIKGPVTIGAGASLIINATTTVSGSIDATAVVSGTYSAKAVLTNKAVLKMDGTGVISAVGDTKLSGISSDNFVGAYYEIGTGTSKAYRYVAADTALAALADGSTDSVSLYGENTIKTSAVVASGDSINMMQGSKLNVGSSTKTDVDFTLSTGASLRDSNSDGIKVYGSLYTERKTDVASSLRAGVDSEVYSYQTNERGDEIPSGWAKWTSLASALKTAESGETIELKGPVSDFKGTIPEGVTVDAHGQTLTVKENSVVTIDGMLDLTSSGSKLILKTKTANSTNKDGSVVLNGRIMYADANSIVLGDSAYTVAGAYYEYDDVLTISTVAYAASIIADVEGQEVTIRQATGVDVALDLGSVSFAGKAADDGATVYITCDFVGTIGLQYAKALVSNDVIADAVFESVDGTADILGKATALVIVHGTYGTGDDAKDILQIAGTLAAYEPAAGSDDVKPAIVLGGTVYVVGTLQLNETTTSNNANQTSVSGTLTVSEGGEVSVVKGVNDADVDVKKLVVEGNLTVASGTLVAAEAEIGGALAVMDSTATFTKATVFGAIDASDLDDNGVAYTGKVIVTELYVGIEDKSVYYPALGSDVSVVGNVVINGFAVVAAGATVPIGWSADDAAAGTATDLNRKSTLFMDENGDEYMTVYVKETSGTSGVLVANFFKDVANADFLGWTNTEGKTAVTSMTVGTGNDATSLDSKKFEVAYVGSSKWTVVSASINEFIFDVTIVTDGSISSVTLNGILMSGPGTFVTAAPIKAGTYTVAFSAASGFDVSGVKLSDSQGNAIDGFTIVIDDDSTVNGKVSYQLTGGQAVTSPSGGSSSGGSDFSGIIDAIDKNTEAVKNQENGGSSDSSLTDILLIVLVVLIVIMAILVAMRMMRS